MKKILLLLFLTAVPLLAQRGVQKNDANVLSNGPIVVGPGNSITATGNGTIAATSIPALNINTTAPLTGGGSLSGSLTLAIPVATSSVNGYLSSTDWATFNAKQAAGNYLSALTGDATAAGPGSAVLTLATVNGNVGTFGSSTQVPQITVNGKGLITAVANVTIGPSQTGNSGKFLTTNGTAMSWSLVGNASLANSAITVGSTSISLGSSATALAGLNSVTAAPGTSLTLNGGPSLMVIQSQSGAVFTGTVGGGAGIARSDASVTISRTTGHAMLDLFVDAVMVSGGEEAVVNFSGRDYAGTSMQLGSLSFIQAFAGSPGVGARTQARLHMNHLSGGSNSDFRATADGGIELFRQSPGGDVSWPGDRIFRVNGNIAVAEMDGNPGGAYPMSMYASLNRLVMQSGSAGFLFQKSDNSATILTILDDLTATFNGAVTGRSFTASGTSTAALTMSANANRLLFQGGTSGYLFQKSDNSATILTLLDNLSATFSGAVTAPSVAYTGGSAAARSIWADATRLIVQGGTAGILIQNSANSVSLLSIVDNGLATVKSLSVSGDAVPAQPLTMRSTSNYLIFNGGSAGFLFQKSDGSATILQFVDSTRAANFSGVVNGNDTTDASVGAASIFSLGGITSTKKIWAGTGLISLALNAPASTDLLLSGGTVSAVVGAQINLGQGANGAVTITGKGTGRIDNVAQYTTFSALGIFKSGVLSDPGSGKALEMGYSSVTDSALIQSYDHDAATYKPMTIGASEVTFAMKAAGVIYANEFLRVGSTANPTGPTAGVGIELYYRTDGANDQGVIQTYNRTTAALKPLTISATNWTVDTSGNAVLSGTLKTTAGIAYNFGASSSTTITTPDKSLKFTVGGTDYYVPAKLTNN